MVENNVALQIMYSINSDEFTHDDDNLLLIPVQSNQRKDPDDKEIINLNEVVDEQQDY